MSEFQNTVRGQLRQLRKSKEQKLVEAYGIADNEGDLRKEGRFMILEALFAPVTADDSAAVKAIKGYIRDYVVGGLQELDASKPKASRVVPAANNDEE